jgi:hypothetical protein
MDGLGRRYLMRRNDEGRRLLHGVFDAAGWVLRQAHAPNLPKNH